MNSVQWDGHFYSGISTKPVQRSYTKQQLPDRSRLQNPFIQVVTLDCPHNLFSVLWLLFILPVLCTIHPLQQPPTQSYCWIWVLLLIPKKSLHIKYTLLFPYPLPLFLISHFPSPSSFLASFSPSSLPFFPLTSPFFPSSFFSYYLPSLLHFLPLHFLL